MTEEIEEILDCGCVLRLEKVIALCMMHEEAYAAKKFAGWLGNSDDAEFWEDWWDRIENEN